MRMRVCAKCSAKKPIDQYSSKKGTIRARCKACTSIDNSAARDAQPPDERVGKQPAPMCPICQWTVERFWPYVQDGDPLPDEYKNQICENCRAEKETGSRDVGESKYKAGAINKEKIV